MTRAEYEKQYGSTPVVATSTLDNDAIPVRMTRAEYNALYRPNTNVDTSAGADVKAGITGAKEAFNREADRRNEVNQRGFLSRNFSKFMGGIGASGEALASVGEGVFRALPGGTTVADKLGDITLSGIETVAQSDIGQSAKAGFESLPEGVQTFAEDVGRGAMGAVGIGGALVAPGASGAVARPVLRSAQETIESIGKRVIPSNDNRINRVATEISDIENNYAKTRNKLDRDTNAETSRLRIAQSNVLDGAVDEDGLIRTKQKGGAIDKYKTTPITDDGLTLLDVEDVVRRNLEVENKKVNLRELKANALGAIMDSGLEGADLAAAIKRIDKDLEGLAIRADEFGDVLLSKVQDNKISTTKHIDYTKPVGTTYRKTLARVYKETIEDKSDLPVKQWNAELAKYYKDIDRLADLDGKRVKGGRLGKYTAQVVGTGIGAAGGSVGGGFGAFVGGALGGEVAGALKGRAMASTFSRGVDGKMPESTILSDAQKTAQAGKRDLTKPDPQVGVSKALLSDPNMPEAVRAQITKMEGQIKSNIKQQKAAIAAGDFTLVEALKTVYTTLVDRLKEIIKDYKKNGIPLGMSIRKTVTPESVAKKADKEDMALLAKVIDDVSMARLDPDTNRVLDKMGLARATDDELVAFAKDVFDEKDGVANREVYRNNDLMSDQNQATNPPTITQSISDTVDDTGAKVNTSNTQLSAAEAKASGMSFDDWVKGQGETLYHATDSGEFNLADFNPKAAAKGEEFFNPLGSGLYASSNKEFVRRFGSNTMELVLPANVKVKKVSIDSWEKDFASISKRALKNMGIKYDDLTLSEKVEINRLVPNTPIESANNFEVVLRDIAERLNKEGSVQDAIQKSVMEQYKNYDVIKYLDTDYAFDADEIVIKDPSILKTRSQLKAEWDSAK
jgi:hypothetical protein